VPKPIQAWLDSGTFEFTDHVSDQMTLAVPSTAATVITVGAAVSGRLGEAAVFSSRGPTRDGREKPDISAAGTEIDAAKSGTASEVIKMSGTSMAAAQVTGIVAKRFEEAATDAANWPTANQIAAALRQTARGREGGWDPALGYGVVDARPFTQAFSRSS
jgi:endonuclease G